MKSLSLCALAFCLISACGGNSSQSPEKPETQDAQVTTLTPPPVPLPAASDSAEADSTGAETIPSAPAPSLEPVVTPVPTLSQALKKLADARAETPAYSSGRLGDFGNGFWPGDGFDMLTGVRTPSCLEPDDLSVKVQPLYETRDTFQFVHSYVDLYKKMESEFGTEIGGAWQMFSASVSVKTSMMQETQITTDDLVAMTSFSYLKEKTSLYNSWPQYAPFFKELQTKSPQLFRRQCGDRYTQDLTSGAGLYLIINARKVDSTKHNRFEVEAAIKAGFASLFTVGQSAKVSNEQKEILKSYSFSTKCYSMGTTADVCGAYNLSTNLDVLADTAAMQQKINEARAKIIAEVKEGKNLVVMRETLKDYEVNLDLCKGNADQPCPDRWAVFYDYRSRAARADGLLDRKREVEEVCSYAKFWPHRCAQVNRQLQTAILNCLSINEACQDPDFNELNVLMTARNPGVVRVWEHSGRGGKFQEMSFQNYYDRGFFRPQQFFNLNELGWKDLNDRITSVETTLQPGWTMRMFEHMDTRAPGRYFDVNGSLFQNLPGWFNDMASAFTLIPPPDLAF